VVNLARRAADGLQTIDEYDTGPEDF